MRIFRCFSLSQIVVCIKTSMFSSVLVVSARADIGWMRVSCDKCFKTASYAGAGLACLTTAFLPLSEKLRTSMNYGPMHPPQGAS